MVPSSQTPDPTPTSRPLSVGETTAALSAGHQLPAAPWAETPAPLTPERLAEYAARADRLMAKCRKRDQASLADVEGLKNDVHTLAAGVERRSFLFNSARDRAENLAAEVERLTAERDELAEWKRRVTEEVEEFEDAAKDDPRTPQIARLMIANLRHAMGGAL